MFTIILTVHIVLCLMLIGLVLLQQGKGADMGAAFGGGSNTLFGASGATDFITKVTTYSAICFMVTSILLVHQYVSGAGAAPTEGNPLAGSVLDGVLNKNDATAKKASAEIPSAGSEASAPAAVAPAAGAIAPTANAAQKGEINSNLDKSNGPAPEAANENVAPAANVPSAKVAGAKAVTSTKNVAGSKDRAGEKSKKNKK